MQRSIVVHRHLGNDGKAGRWTETPVVLGRTQVQWSWRPSFRALAGKEVPGMHGVPRNAETDRNDLGPWASGTWRRHLPQVMPDRTISLGRQAGVWAGRRECMVAGSRECLKGRRAAALA